MEATLSLSEADYEPADKLVQGGGFESIDEYLSMAMRTTIRQDAEELL